MELGKLIPDYPVSHELPLISFARRWLVKWLHWHMRLSRAIMPPQMRNQDDVTVI